MCHNKTVSGINDSGWFEEQVDAVRLRLVAEHIKQQRINDGCLIVDDSLAHKTGKKIEGVGYHYDHSQKEIVLGHQLVSTHYYCRSSHVPLHFEVYLKESGFTKNQLARNLIDRAVVPELPFSVVLLDSWYFNKENTDYRDAKQNLGWEAIELRIWKGIKRHFPLVFLAFTLLQLSSLNRGLGKWLNANSKTIGGKCQMAAVEVLRAFILFVAKETSQERSPDEIAELCFRPAAQIRFAFT